MTIILPRGYEERRCMEFRPEVDANRATLSSSKTTYSSTEVSSRNGAYLMCWPLAKDLAGGLGCPDGDVSLEIIENPHVRAMRALVSVMVPAVAVAVIAAGVWTAISPGHAENKSPSDDPHASVSVVVVRSTSACFTAAIRVTGFFVPSNEAVVILDAPGMKISEVLVREGDRVVLDQTLARLTRQSTEGPDPTGGKTSLTSLRAPAAGIITKSNAAVGATPPVMPTEPLFRIAVGDEIELEVEVPTIHVPSLARGQTARIEIGENAAVLGRVRLVPAMIDRRMQLGRARISLERDPSLRVGMFASATIDANRSCGVSVPSTAVSHRTEGTSVQIVHNNTIEKRLVQVGLRSDTHTEIRDGLREGEMVVADAGSSLRPGDKVKPVDGPSPGQR
jgi:multidrug efflux pump subunit AcrA (membrane-fusion protein)